MDISAIIAILFATIYILILYRKRIYFTTMYWLAFYLITFILPLVLNRFIDYGIFVHKDTYRNLNISYLAVLCFFIFTNFINMKIKSSHKLKKITTINYSVFARSNKIFLALALSIVIIVGGESLFAGSSNVLHGRSGIFNYLIPIVVFGINMSAFLRTQFLNTRKEMVISFINISFALLFGLLFSFARRLLIYPIIITFSYYIIARRKKKIKIYKLLFIALLLIVIVLPSMVSIRTHGLVQGIINFQNVITNLELLRNYLAMSTDVSWSYSLASVVLQNGIRLSPMILFKPIFIFIPRFIWATKPLPLSLQIVREMGLSENPDMSIPLGIVGESIVYFGIAGLIIFGVLWGIVTSSLDKKINQLTRDVNGKESMLLIFLLTIAVQVISGSLRGDLSTTLIETELVILPYFILLYLSKIKVKL